MKISKKLTFCIVLCFALLLGGCSYIPGLSGNTDEATKEKGTLNQQLQEKQKQVDDSRTKLSGLDSSLKTEKQKCEDMTKETKKLGKNPLDEKESPQTFAQCQKVKSIETRIGEAKNELEKAENELETAKTQGNKGTTDQKDSEKSDYSWLLWLFGGIAGLAVFSALILFAYKKINNMFKAERSNTLEGFRVANGSIEKLNRKVVELEQVVKFQREEFPRFQKSLDSLQTQVLQRGEKNFQQQQPIFTQPVYKPKPQFPVSTEDYRNKVGQNARTATADSIGGRLIHDDRRGNEFLIVRDAELQNGQFYAVPNQIKFDAKADYHTYYQNYYACENPSGGAIWIKSPAIVREIEGGWQLESMGELEIKLS